jgi:hypothetical protein
MFHEETMLAFEGHEISRIALRGSFHRCNSLAAPLDHATKLFQFALVHEYALLHEPALSMKNAPALHEHPTKTPRAIEDERAEKLDD